MNEFETMGKWVMLIGGTLVLVGGLVWLLSKVPLFGHLPGDIHIEKPGFTCLVPLASSIILSILLTIVVNIIARLLRR
jgi:hypothetical protein